MEKFVGEFKKFITRGNILDMAVGIIVGSAFTAIVNSLSNNILKPFINYVIALVFDAESLSEIYTFLKRAEKVDEATGESVVDLANSIYIDWGAFLNAIINFLLIAIVLFSIVKVINTIKEGNAELKKSRISRADRKAMKARGIKLRNREAVKAYFAEKEKKAAAEKAAAEAAAKEKARLEREANPTSEDLLKKIITILETK